jgi:hypothetical protein
VAGSLGVDRPAAIEIERRMSFEKLGILFKVFPDFDQDVDHLHLGVQTIREGAPQFLFDRIHHPGSHHSSPQRERAVKYGEQG